MESDHCVPGSDPILGDETHLSYGALLNQTTKPMKSRPSPVQIRPADVFQPDRRLSEPGTPTTGGMLTPGFLSNLGMNALDMFDTTPTSASLGELANLTGFECSLGMERRPSESSSTLFIPSFNRRMSDVRPTQLNLSYTASVNNGAGAAVGSTPSAKPEGQVDVKPESPVTRAPSPPTIQTSRGRIVRRPMRDIDTRGDSISPDRSPSPAPASSKRSSLKIPAVKRTRATRNARSSPLPLKPDGVLPSDHRPARGRGRQQQLKHMSVEQIEAEAEARLEKNRLAARDCRLRRKEHMAELEETMQMYITRDNEQKNLIAKLQAQVRELQRANGMA